MGEDALKQKVFEALAFDPLATAEHITGQHYTEDRETSGLGLRLSMRNNFVKNVILGELGDTHYRISWKKFLEIIDDLGFDIVEDRQFEYVLGLGTIILYPTNLIAAHPNLNLLLHATSYLTEGADEDQETLNSGNIYGTLRITEPDREKVWEALGACHCSFAFHGDDIELNIDVREGLKLKLERLATQGRFVPWGDTERSMTVWLADYVEHKHPEYSSSLRWERFLAESPPWVRDFITKP
ncbi:MAG: hypothetical protein A3A80_01650 [Candidatus Terrybacteria bacterium RIFCSPLOWO2_01_FULL_44_24]|uniref:Uncharacterized protein n=1 Tax=Candidatus Terrybacteria bacterium RIFCSPHIGHO2_01_FULL_43_35 TaxID=1802361 RepID=A0A1G2PFI7_9BACT|nr:MAG: hypothetical protein A2828_04030 [Candidatus Terrybacteria bacterium RIFCSPHIGHO2_01_FULL_43_35]OHA49899.1 MAG: hypothetical protein A3B75_03275 [Candidatus Terrybacteria bacterium RIFCSPHIGHO2_02_FULL_43_14]OHA51780.1 MAG: hypothetical protein A3A80_01650 [Candidatus Terrybacteria bacterium RIFCSPLOWO2_01_FULL_44_24]